MTTKSEVPARKLHYDTPVVTRIPFRADEVVLGGCKNDASTSGKNAGGGTTCSIPLPCATSSVS